MKLVNKKSIFLLLIISLVFVFFYNNIKSTDEFYNPDEPTEGINVKISISCHTVLDNYSKLSEELKQGNYIPENGIILDETPLFINNGDTVLDALIAVTTQNEIPLEYSQSNNDTYVEGINYLYEFSCGELSGWMYKVNGEFATKGCNSYILKDNDTIEWVYTCDLGDDVGEGFSEVY